MNIYLISQKKNRGYDTYNSAVVCAESEEAAKLTCPSDYPSDYLTEGKTILTDKDSSYGWVTDPKDVKCELIGIAVEGSVASVIVASFNAG